MRNPFARDRPSSRFAGASERQVDAAYASLGWGQTVSRPVPREDGPPLTFRCRMPTGLRFVALADLVAAATGAPAWVDDATQALPRAADAAGAVLVGAVLADGDEVDVFATLTVCFSERVRDPRAEIETPGPEERVRQDVVRIDDHCTLVKRIMVHQAGPDAPALPMLVAEFRWALPEGGLIMAFTSTHAGGMSDRAAAFYTGVARDAELLAAD